MANIAFVTLPEKGHLISSFKIAKTLLSRGHRIYYLQLPEFEEYIRSQGLEFFPLFEKIFPKGCEFYHHLSTIENLDLRLQREADSLDTTTANLLKKELNEKLGRLNLHLLVRDIYAPINTDMLEIGTPC